MIETLLQDDGGLTRVVVVEAMDIFWKYTHKNYLMDEMRGVKKRGVMNNSRCF